MSGESERLLKVAEAIFDEGNPDWDAAVREASDEEERQLLQELRGIASLFQAHEHNRAECSPRASTPSPAHTGTEQLLEVEGYRPIRRIGEGLLGITYEAERTAAPGEHMALKVIKWEMDLRRLSERIARVLDAHAALDRPDVAPLLDVGATRKAHIYLARRYVSGVTVTAFCEREGLALHERLRLFLEACEALTAVHGEGLLHRAIKPTNLLVRDSTATPSIRVVDLGQAEILSQPRTEWTLSARHGLGMPFAGYVSPEELLLPEGEIDVRADVYSLGALLLHLITGQSPLAHATRWTARDPQLRKSIVETTAPRPATGSPLEPVVAKALARDREERFDTVEALASEVRKAL